MPKAVTSAVNSLNLPNDSNTRKSPLAAGTRAGVRGSGEKPMIRQRNP